MHAMPKQAEDESPSLDEVMAMMEGAEVEIKPAPRDPLIVEIPTVVSRVIEERASEGALSPDVQALVEEEDPPPAPKPEPKPARQKVDPWKVTPRWSAWDVSVKTSEDEKVEAVRQVLAEMDKTGAKTGFIPRGDCVIFATRTADGTIHLYDCQARRQAKV